MSAPKDALALTLGSGWIRVPYVVGKCPAPTCGQFFSAGWNFPAAKAREGKSLGHPRGIRFFQTVGTPKHASKMFIEEKVIVLVRSIIVRAKCGFDAVARMLTDLHGYQFDENDRHILFYAWLLHDTLALLWEHRPELVQTLRWHVTVCHDRQMTRNDLHAALPLLRDIFDAEHTEKHSCATCASKVLAIDGKSGITCEVCNCREGGDVYYQKSTQLSPSGATEAPSRKASTAAATAIWTTPAVCPSTKSCDTV